MANGAQNMPTVPQYQNVTPLAINYPNWAQFGTTPGGAPDPYDYFRIQNEMFRQGYEALPTDDAAADAGRCRDDAGTIAAAQTYQRGMLPVDIERAQAMIPLQQQAAAAMIPTDVARQQAMMRGAFGEQMQQPMSQAAAQQYGIEANYIPSYRQIFQNEANIANPQFMPTYNALGKSVRRDCPLVMVWVPGSQLRLNRRYGEGKQLEVIGWDRRLPHRRHLARAKQQ